MILGLTDTEGRLMAKRTPLTCTPDNCGENYPACGKSSTYVNRKCRCDPCAEACREKHRKMRAARVWINAGDCSPGNCGEIFAKCGKVSTYSHCKCRCSSCLGAMNAYSRQRYSAAQPRNYGECSPDNCGELFLKCGTPGTFIGRKCKCSVCKAAARAKNKQQIPSGAGRNYGDCSRENCGDTFRLCGTTTTYRRKKCRCSACNEAVRRYENDSYKKDPSKKKLKSQIRRARVKGVLCIEYTAEQLARKYEYWGNTCHIQGPNCNGVAEDIEHVIPISLDGPNILANIRPSCETCNGNKGSQWPFPIRLIPGGKVKQ